MHKGHCMIQLYMMQNHQPKENLVISRDSTTHLVLLKLLPSTFNIFLHEKKLFHTGEFLGICRTG